MPDDEGLFTAVARTLFSAARCLSLSHWVARCFPLGTARRVRAIEYCVLGWLVVEAALILVVVLNPSMPLLGRGVVVLLAAARILDIVQALANVAVFDLLSDPEGRPISGARTVVLASVNFLELAACFGIIYAASYERLRGAGQPLTAFYFSLITQLTIGYGDVHPAGPWLRTVAALHGLVSAFFVVLVFARLLTVLPPFSEQPGTGQESRRSSDAPHRGE